MKVKNYYSTVIFVPRQEDMEEVSRHLRYWPYVKFYRFDGHNHISACFHLGTASNPIEHKMLCNRSRHLICLCLSQYNVRLSKWRARPSYLMPKPNANLFLRPINALRPIEEFLCKIDK